MDVNTSLCEKYAYNSFKNYTVPSSDYVDTLITLLDSWISFMPKWFIQYLLNRVVIPNLVQFIESYELKDKESIFILLVVNFAKILDASQMEEIYLSVQTKLINNIRNWHPSDLSLISQLDNWCKYLPSKTIDTIILKMVLPKLNQYLEDNFDVNPASQDIKPIKLIFKWVQASNKNISSNKMIQEHLAKILINNFFTKWLSVLHSWLNQPQEIIDYNHISKWYKGWKSIFPSIFLSNTKIKEHFYYGILMVDFSLDKKQLQSDHIKFILNIKKHKKLEISKDKTTKPMEIKASALNPKHLTFKEMVESIALENGLLFRPESNISFDDLSGIKYYRFGSILIYIDRNVIFCPNSANSSKFEPINIENLIKKAKS